MTHDRVTRLNEVQARWMALSPGDPGDVKAAVFKAMEDRPKTYLSLSADRSMATVISQGMPLHAGRIPVAAALRYQGVDQGVAWHGTTGRWEAMPPDTLGRVQTVCEESAYGTTTRLSFQIKVF